VSGVSGMSGYAALTRPTGLWPRTGSNSSWLQYRKAADKSGASRFDNIQYRIDQTSSTSRRKANQHHATGLAHFCINQVTEVFVLGDQYSPAANRPVHYHGIFGARPQFGNCDDIMSHGAQRTDNGEIAAFIRQEAHALSSRAFFGCDENGLFMSDRIGRVSYGGLNIAPGYAWVSFEKFRFGRALAKFS